MPFTISASGFRSAISPQQNGFFFIVYVDKVSHERKVNFLDCTQEIMESDSDLIDQIRPCSFTDSSFSGNFTLTSAWLDKTSSHSENSFRNDLQSFPPNCQAAKAYEMLPARKLANSGDNLAKIYYSDCKKGTLDFPLPGILPLTDRSSIETDFYGYKPQKQNPLLFEEINVKQSGDVQYRTVAKNASFKIKANLWPVGSLNFGPDDIVTRIVSSTEISRNLLHRYSFFLRLLGFNIDMKLHSNAIFLNDTVAIPLMFSFPVVPKKWLKEHSGLLYSWLVPSQEVRFDWVNSSIPIYTSYLKSQKGILCNQAVHCSFTLQGKAYLQNFELAWVIPKEDVSEGFFPIFIDDFSLFSKTTRWNIAEDTKVNEKEGNYQPQAVFFDISKLKRKFYQWRFWINIKSNEFYPSVSHSESVPVALRPSKKVLFYDEIVTGIRQPQIKNQ